MKKKKCTQCGEEKILRKFSKRKNYNGTKKVYYLSHCKDCASKKTDEWIKKNRDKFRRYQKNYYKNKNAKNKAKTTA